MREGVNVEIRVLGPPEVIDESGRAVVVSGARLARLLVVLALRLGEVVSDERLGAIVWGEDALPGRNALHRQVSTLRGLLGSADAVVRRGGGYALAVDPAAVDSARFEALAAEGRSAVDRGELAAGAALLRRALDLWRGDQPAEVSDGRDALGDLRRLAEMRMTVVEACIDAELGLGRHVELVAELEQLVALHPLREHLWGQLMLALSRAGRQTEALRAYQTARRLLAEEVGLELSPELRALEAAILRQEEHTVRAEPSIPVRRPSLRVPLTSLFGRRDELDALAARLRRRRLVTLVGPGGVGKTRLALEAAREVRDGGMLDVWFVELADVADPDGVVAAIASTLGLPTSIDTELDLTRIVEFLCGRGALVVLDNCEHVIDAAARAARDILELCSTTRILATSRERLGVAGEAVMTVHQLALTDAVSMFVERGWSAGPASDLVGDGGVDWASVEAVCARLDCLPLAIELAASRLGSMPLGDLAAGLDDRFRLLNRGARTADRRQQTLRAVIDWSYDLLFEDERRVLERLSVFTGGCDLDAASVVCADDVIGADDVAELASRLADKSLLVVDDDGGRMRYRMLETVVEYGRQRLVASGDADRVRARHAHYYRDLAVSSGVALRGEQQHLWLRRIGANLGNLRAVFDTALASGDAESSAVIAGSLGWYWWFTGRALEGSTWLALARRQVAPTTVLAAARVAAWSAFVDAPGFVAWTRPDERAGTAAQQPGEDTHEVATAAICGYREAGAFDELAPVETALSVTFTRLGDPARAAELLADAERILSGLDPAPWVAAMQAFTTGRLAFVEDRYTDAEAWLRRSVVGFEAIGGDVHAAFAERYLGRIHAVGGDHTASATAIRSALARTQEMGLSGFTDVLLTDLGAALAARGAFDDARQVLARPLASARDQRVPAGVAASLIALAWVEWQAGRMAVAGELATEALEAIGAAGDVDTLAHGWVIVGLAASHDGDVTAAEAALRRGLAAAAQSADRRTAALVLEAHAAHALAAQDAVGAARCCGAASGLRRAPGRASGWVFAPVRPVDADDVLRGAARLAGDVAVRAAFDEGAAEPALALHGLTGACAGSA
jgi:predicted ATPase/DNA-binding SARP family transcriptional activator